MSKTQAPAWLKDAIEEYLQSRHPDQRPDGVDICAYMKLTLDMPYIALQELETEHRVIRHEAPQGSWYEAMKRAEIKEGQ